MIHVITSCTANVIITLSNNYFLHYTTFYKKINIGVDSELDKDIDKLDTI